jgi:ribose transport system ATP-binding protein
LVISAVPADLQSTDPPPLLAVHGVTKRFAGVTALQDVSLHLIAGEVLALMGENGAGKSSLVKILAGSLTPEAGSIQIDGETVAVPSVSAAKKLGIALIHQELMLAPNLDIVGNLFLGRETRRGPWGTLDRHAMYAAAEAWLAQVGLNFPPDTLVADLNTGQMQLVEIAKALSVNARILIMDEPTSSLARDDINRLLTMVDTLRRAGMGIIYISHRIEEVMRIADRIVVLRDGKFAGELPVAEANHDRIVSLMVGRELKSWYPPRTHVPGDVVLEVNSLHVIGAPEGVSFTARRGEILGFAGLVGAGRTELMKALFGIDASLGGSVLLDGRPYRARRPADAIARGIAFVPEDRKLHGLVLSMSVAENVSLPGIAGYRPRWLLQRGTERRVTDEQVLKLRIKTPGIGARVNRLSGGTQQKVVLGKWLAMHPKLLILDEPTRGIDVGAKAEIYAKMIELVESGITILLVSSEMEEVIGMCDRIVVMHERRIRGILSTAEFSEERIAELMTGKGSPA